MENLITDAAQIGSQEAAQTVEPAETIQGAEPTAESAADQQDAFLSGWSDEGDETADGAGASSAADGQPDEAQNQTQTPPQPGTAVDNAGTENDGGQSVDNASAADQPQSSAEPPALPSWVVRHLDDPPFTIKADDARIPELLQKGMDYERVREKWDEAKPVMELFSAYAKQANMSVSDYTKFIRAEAKKAQGLSEDEAKRAVDLEDREAAISAQEAARQQADNAKAAAQNRINSDIEEFSRAFPEAYQQAATDPKSIPQSVWDRVNQGASLTVAYARYAVEQAQNAAATAAQAAQTSRKNADNAARSTGSMRSAGSDVKTKDAFLEGFGRD